MSLCVRVRCQLRRHTIMLIHAVKRGKRREVGTTIDILAALGERGANHVRSHCVNEIPTGSRRPSCVLYRKSFRFCIEDYLAKSSNRVRAVACVARGTHNVCQFCTWSNRFCRSSYSLRSGRTTKNPACCPSNRAFW